MTYLQKSQGASHRSLRRDESKESLLGHWQQIIEMRLGAGEIAQLLRYLLFLQRTWVQSCAQWFTAICNSSYTGTKQHVVLIHTSMNTLTDIKMK